MDLQDVRIFVSAYACEPTRGSEPGIGWNLVRELSRRHKVWALTRENNEPLIRAELSRTPLPNLTMVYFDLPRGVRAWKRGAVGIDFYYRLWQLLAQNVVRRLDRVVGFDIAQHVTFGRYWGPTALADLGKPFIWGPVGGGESAPPAFHADFGFRGRMYENLRTAARRCGEWDPAVRHAARRASLALAVTSETRARLEALGTRQTELFSAMGVDRGEYDRLSAMSPPPAGTVRFTSMGRLLHWKGFHLGLKAFAAAMLPHSEYWIVGDGPERANLTQIVRQLGIEHQVRFCGALARSAALDVLAQCHALVHPSLHDSGGWVCLEAMAGGRPVLCLDLGGPSEQVTDETGIKIAAGHPGQAIQDLATAMRRIASDEALRRALGDGGRRRVEREYLWEKKGERLDGWYRSVLSETIPPRVRPLPGVPRAHEAR